MTTNQTFSVGQEDGEKRSKVDFNEAESNSESDDFDEFYNDQSFLNTGLGQGMNN